MRCFKQVSERIVEKSIVEGGGEGQVGEVEKRAEVCGRESSGVTTSVLLPLPGHRVVLLKVVLRSGCPSNPFTLNELLRIDCASRGCSLFALKMRTKMPFFKAYCHSCELAFRLQNRINWPKGSRVPIFTSLRAKS